MSQDELLRAYDEKIPLYSTFTERVESLISELLQSYGVQAQSITSRTKERKSFLGKLIRNEEKYSKLEDITDISGVRITCWFLDQIQLVERVIKENFKIAEELSVDKRADLDPDRFGYLSVHYIVSLSPNRTKLHEFEKYDALYCEIQVRTILQHAWAEIEHDLGYKSQIEVPRDLKRRFYRLAGLFELADDELQGLKKEIESYSSVIAEKIKNKEESVLIDKTSLESYVNGSEIIHRIDLAISKSCINNAELEAPRVTIHDLEILKFFNIKTIEELDSILKKEESNIVKVAQSWLKEKRCDSFRRGIAIFYLGYTLAVKTKDVQKIESYTKIFGWHGNRTVANRLYKISQVL